jgi:hypothetical protein
MQELAWIAEVIRIWIEGGSWAEIKAAHGFQTLVGLAAFLVPSTIIALGIGLMDWHETPMGMWLGARSNEDEENWVERARDLDKDGMPDF